MIEGSETEDIVVVVFIRYTGRRPRARSISCGAPNPTRPRCTKSRKSNQKRRRLSDRLFPSNPEDSRYEIKLSNMRAIVYSVSYPSVT